MNPGHERHRAIASHRIASDLTEPRPPPRRIGVEGQLVREWRVRLEEIPGRVLERDRCPGETGAEFRGVVVSDIEVVPDDF